jgi:hypothetical protein
MDMSGQLHAPAASALEKELPIHIIKEAGCDPDVVE